MNLILIGQRASGKTSAGLRLSERVKAPFLDTDDEAAGLLGRPVSRIFAEEGEAAFRAAESRVARTLSRLDGYIVAAGGGMPADGDNRGLIKRSGRVVWLDCPPELLIGRRRAERKSESRPEGPRPPLTGLPLEEEIRLLHHQRRGFYAQTADAVIDTGELSLEEVVVELERIWRELDPHRMQ